MSGTNHTQLKDIEEKQHKASKLRNGYCDRFFCKVCEAERLQRQKVGKE